MIAALRSFVILGIPTTIKFLEEVLAHPEFAAGNTHTHFIAENFPQWQPGAGDDKLLDIALAAGALASADDQRDGSRSRATKRPTPWQTTGKWMIGGH
jgi:acetyl/propionyl-CoA carboxylase alpha subunit